MPEKLFILRADDIGSAFAANDAILAACDAGIVKNVSIMVCGPAFAAAAERLRGRDDLCLGLHVTLNAEWAEPAVRWKPILPAEQVPSLIEPETGFFTPTPRHLQDRGFSVTEAAAEAAAQLTAARAAGLKITYLDEHMGVGWLPGLRDELAGLASREGLIDAIALNPAHLSIPLPVGADATGWTNAFLTAAENAEPGTYLMVTHPAYRMPETEWFYATGATPGQVAAERNREADALTSALLREGVRERGLQIVRYDEVGR